MKTLRIGIERHLVEQILLQPRLLGAALLLSKLDRIDAVEQPDHGVLQRIEQGSGILFALTAFRHQTLDQRTQLIGGGTGVVRRHLGKALRCVLGRGAGDGLDIDRGCQTVRCRMHVGRMRPALHLSQRVRYDRELFLDDVQSRKLILRLNEMIDDLANVRLDQGE